MSLNNLKTEVAFLLRNSDIMTTTERGVTTTTATGTLDADTTFLINKTNVKNIRSIVVGEITLKYGDDYLLDLDYNDAGTIKTQITFNLAQTGDITVTYDYGSDKIHTDFPREDLTITSFPRISVDIITGTDAAFGVGAGVFISDTMFTVIVYSESQEYIEAKLELIKTMLINSCKSLYYAPFITPAGQGPIIKSDNRGQMILHRNRDFRAMFQTSN